MASIYQRTNKDGSKVWRAVIRIKNHRTISDHFDRKKAAEDWAKETETKIKNGKYDFTKNREKTVAELIDLYIQDAVIGHHKAADDTIFQLNYFKEKIGKYALTYITPEAQALFDQWQLPFENKNRSGRLSPYFEAHLFKYKKLLPSLCLILEHLKQATIGVYPQSILIEALKAALLWLDYFESYAHRIYNSSANVVLKAACNGPHFLDHQLS